MNYRLEGVSGLQTAAKASALCHQLLGALYA